MTKIEAKHLRDFRIENACVATKLSWASERKTTRLEDRAYSLMGLLDINMPLLYGEGHKAFRRLLLEIVRNYSDETIFCWDFRGYDFRKSFSSFLPLSLYSKVYITQVEFFALRLAFFLEPLSDFLLLPETSLPLCKSPQVPQQGLRYRRESICIPFFMLSAHLYCPS